MTEMEGAFSFPGDLYMNIIYILSVLLRSAPILFMHLTLFVWIEMLRCFVHKNK